MNLCIFFLCRSAILYQYSLSVCVSSLKQKYFNSSASTPCTLHAGYNKFVVSSTIRSICKLVDQD